jgi:hypothetical protein
MLPLKSLKRNIYTTTMLLSFFIIYEMHALRIGMKQLIINVFQLVIVYSIILERSDL